MHLEGPGASLRLVDGGTRGVQLHLQVHLEGPKGVQLHLQVQVRLPHGGTVALASALGGFGALYGVAFGLAV